MMLLARALSRTPMYSSHVIASTITAAGTFSRIGMPANRGAVCSKAWTAGSLLRSAVRYPCVNHAGIVNPNPERSDMK